MTIIPAGIAGTLAIGALLLGATALAQSNASFNSRPPNAPTQQPAFAGQTRAPVVDSKANFDVVTVASGLVNPWGMAFLPGGDMLVTERPGRLRIVGADGRLSAPVSGLPAVDARRQGGLFGVTLDPNFASNNLIYWSYAQPHENGETNSAVARGKLVRDGGQARVDDVQVIFEQAPSMASELHYGGRLVFAPDGALFVTLGERSILPGRAQAQNLDSLLGKIVRINSDGSVRADNPFVGQPGVRPKIWSYGHRNVEGAALNPATGELWTIEHGARGGDELNIPRKGKDYGWPTISYGTEYSGQPIPGGITQKEGMEQPLYYWDPVIAPGGMTFYTGALFPAWRNNLFIAGLGSKSLVRLVLDGEKVVGEERFLTDREKRIRDVKQGPDGALYLLTDDAEGELLKLVPKN